MENEKVTLSKETEALITAYRTACKLFELIDMAENGGEYSKTVQTSDLSTLCSIICEKLKSKVTYVVGEKLEHYELAEI